MTSLTACIDGLQTLSKLQAFQKTLKAAKQVGGGSASADAAPVRSKPVTKETVGSLVDDYENEVDEDGLGWMAHKVKFMKRYALVCSVGSILVIAAYCAGAVY